MDERERLARLIAFPAEWDRLHATHRDDIMQEADRILAAGYVRIPAPGSAEEQFAAYFRKNYPGPDTIIMDPDWHAPRIFRAVLAALRAETP